MSDGSSGPGAPAQAPPAPGGAQPAAGPVPGGPPAGAAPGPGGGGGGGGRGGGGGAPPGGAPPPPPRRPTVRRQRHRCWAPGLPPPRHRRARPLAVLLAHQLLRCPRRRGRGRGPSAGPTLPRARTQSACGHPAPASVPACCQPLALTSGASPYSEPLLSGHAGSGAPRPPSAAEPPSAAAAAAAAAAPTPEGGW